MQYFAQYFDDRRSHPYLIQRQMNTAVFSLVSIVLQSFVLVDAFSNTETASFAALVSLFVMMIFTFIVGVLVVLTKSADPMLRALLVLIHIGSVASVVWVRRPTNNTHLFVIPGLMFSQIMGVQAWVTVFYYLVYTTYVIMLAWWEIWSWLAATQILLTMLSVAIASYIMTTNWGNITSTYIPFDIRGALRRMELEKAVSLMDRAQEDGTAELQFLADALRRVVELKMYISPSAIRVQSIEANEVIAEQQLQRTQSYEVVNEDEVAISMLSYSKEEDAFLSVPFERSPPSFRRHKLVLLTFTCPRISNFLATAARPVGSALLNELMGLLEPLIRDHYGAIHFVNGCDVYAIFHSVISASVVASRATSLFLAKNISEQWVETHGAPLTALDASIVVEDSSPYTIVGNDSFRTVTFFGPLLEYGLKLAKLNDVLRTCILILDKDIEMIDKEIHICRFVDVIACPHQAHKRQSECKVYEVLPACKVDPSAIVEYNCGVQAYHMGAVDTAVDIFERYTNVNPADEPAVRVLAISKYLTTHPEEVRQSFVRPWMYPSFGIFPFEKTYDCEKL